WVLMPAPVAFRDTPLADMYGTKENQSGYCQVGWILREKGFGIVVDFLWCYLPGREIRISILQTMGYRSHPVFWSGAAARAYNPSLPSLAYGSCPIRRGHPWTESQKNLHENI
ncbi:MAG: hypothetical protein PHF57_04340, partial [Methanoregula sp.]|nr:hypothetical protein [Methanoregula sp.]